MPAKALLVSYAGYPFSPTSFMPDNGLASLAACLINSGREAQILDFNTPELVGRLYPEFLSRLSAPVAEKILAGKKPSAGDIAGVWTVQKLLGFHQRREAALIGRETAALARERGVDFVGLKLWNGDGFSGSLRIAAEIKKMCPGIRVFGGGPHVDIFRENIFSMTRDFDALVYGEGEESIVMLAEHCEGGAQLRDIPNLIFRENGRTVTTGLKRIGDLDSLPPAVYDGDVYPAMKGDGKIKMIVLDESRGCNNSCYFCIHPVKSGRLRTKSASRVADEMASLKAEYGFSVFRYAGSNTPPGLLKSISREIKSRKMSVEYTTFGHVRGADEEVFRLLRESGCFGVFFGIESGSARVLKRGMNKGVSPAQTLKAIKYARKAGLFAAGSVISPAPGESAATEEETLKLLSSAAPDSAPVQFPLLVPGTRWFEEPGRFGFDIDETSFIREAMNYKIKFMFPPRFWKPFPYTVNGRPFREYAVRLGEFIKKVESLGIVTGISDEMALLAKHAGMSPEKFRDAGRAALLCGDRSWTRRLVSAVNSSILSRDRQSAGTR